MPLREKTSAPAPVLVVAAALITGNRQVFVQQRPAGKQHGGLWEFPGGKVEPGEAPEAALARELSEELGITVATRDMRPLSFATIASADRHLVLLLYGVRAWTGTPRGLAAAATRWVDVGALHGLEMPPADVPLIDVLAREVRLKPQPPGAA